MISQRFWLKLNKSLWILLLWNSLSRNRQTTNDFQFWHRIRFILVSFM